MKVLWESLGAENEKFIRGSDTFTQIRLTVLKEDNNTESFIQFTGIDAKINAHAVIKALNMKVTRKI